MKLGGGLAAAGATGPAVELAVASSVLVLGALLTVTARPPVAIGMAIVAAFAVFQGLAHGAELPQTAGPAIYALGFLDATATLHAIGVALGRALESQDRGAMRWGGGAIAAAGIALVVL